jgi:hypothetical protein
MSKLCGAFGQKKVAASHLSGIVKSTSEKIGNIAINVA